MAVEGVESEPGKVCMWARQGRGLAQVRHGGSGHHRQREGAVGFELRGRLAAIQYQRDRNRVVQVFVRRCAAHDPDHAALGTACPTAGRRSASSGLMFGASLRENTTKYWGIEYFRIWSIS